METDLVSIEQQIGNSFWFRLLDWTELVVDFEIRCLIWRSCRFEDLISNAMLWHNFLSMVIQIDSGISWVILYKLLGNFDAEFRVTFSPTLVTLMQLSIQLLDATSKQFWVRSNFGTQISNSWVISKAISNHTDANLKWVWLDLGQIQLW